jgi:hypothetical protein
LEAFPAIDWSPLSRLKGHRRILATLRTRSSGFGTLLALTAQHLTPLGFTGLTALGFISETLVGKEQLFPCRKYKLSAAIDAFQ